ncbi:MAG TPA: recombinase family protein [Candidatus Omnitrophota bacterium]|nr:recombinase family protein [Candidatus Omnitrophota bacterium]
MISNDKKVALYARVSTEEQASNFSLPAQLELLRKHAADNGYTVFNEYVDAGYSGTVLDRPAFQKMLQDAKNSEFNLILVYRLDRFFRNNRALLTVTEELERFGVGIKSITEPFDTSNHLGKFILSLFGSLAQLERDTFMERSKMGRMRRAKEGYYSGANPTKYGFKCTEDRRHLEICPEEAEIVKLVFKWYCEPDASLVRVAKRLTKLGYKSRENVEWKGDAIHDIIRDPIYIGKWYANRYGPKGKLKPQKDWIEVSVPSIVSESVFQKAQSLLIERRNYTTRNVKYQYLLQGLAKCGDCGNAIAGTADRQRQKKNGKVYGPYFNLYYRCTHFSKNIYKKTIKCNLRYMQVESVDSVVWKEIESLLENPKLIEDIVKQQNKRDPKQVKDSHQELAKIEARLKVLGKEEFRILEAYRQEIISIEQLKSQMAKIKAETVKLSLGRDEAVSLLTKGDSVEVEKAINYVAQIKKGLNANAFDSKKRILHLLNTRVVAKVSGAVDVYCTIPTTELRFSDQTSNVVPASPSEGPHPCRRDNETTSTVLPKKNFNVVSLSPSEGSICLRSAASISRSWRADFSWSF